MKGSFIIYISFTLFVISCDMTNQKLILVNNSDKTVYYRLLIDTVITYDTHVSEIFSYDSVRPLFANKGKNTWEFKINEKSIDSTLYIYIFNSEINNTELPNPKGIKIKDLNGDIIEKRKFVMKGFKVKDLDGLNWVVTYPNNFE